VIPAAFWWIRASFKQAPVGGRENPLKIAKGSRQAAVVLDLALLHVGPRLFKESQFDCPAESKLQRFISPKFSDFVLHCRFALLLEYLRFSGVCRSVAGITESFQDEASLQAIHPDLFCPRGDTVPE